MSDCSCTKWEGETSSHTATFSGSPFETLLREDLGDYHGAIPHRGRVRCMSCGATFAYDSDLSRTTMTRETEVDQVIAFLRAGKVAQVGGGRTFSSYEIRDGQPMVVNYDEGHGEDIPVTESRLRELVEDHRALFADYLKTWTR